MIAKMHYSWKIEIVDFHLVLLKLSLIIKMHTYQMLDT